MGDLIFSLLKQADLERLLTVGFLTAARWIPLLVLAPFFAARAMPLTARLGLALGLTVLVFPAASLAAGPLPRTTLELGLLVGRELLVGAVLGLLCAIPFQALEAAGRLMDTVRGARMAEILASPTEVRASPLGAFLLLLGVVLFLLLDGHLLVVQAAAESYRVLPIGASLSPQAPEGVLQVFLFLGSRFFVIALGLAAPVVATALLLDLALGMAGRVAPQLPLYFLGLPVKALGGVAMLLLTLSLVVWSMGGLFRLTLWAVETGIRTLGG